MLISPNRFKLLLKLKLWLRMKLSSNFARNKIKITFRNSFSQSPRKHRSTEAVQVSREQSGITQQASSGPLALQLWPKAGSEIIA